VLQITVDDVGVLSIDTSSDVQVEVVTFEADVSPMSDVSMIGITGLQLCQGHAIYQMRRYEMTASNPGNPCNPGEMNCI